jgi:hypothetical protein
MAVAEHEEAYSSYWLLTPFKLYAYWWSFVFAYFSGERGGLEPETLLMKCQRRSSKALMLLTPCKLYAYWWSFVFAHFSDEHLASSASLGTDSNKVIACASNSAGGLLAVPLLMPLHTAMR